MTDRIDIDQVLAFMTETITRAGAEVLSYHRGEFGIERKNVKESSIDIVTDADRASEDIIVEAIRQRFPDHDIVSEERPPELSGSPWRWFIDPLDGTVNFSHRYPVFSVSMALAHEHSIVAGTVYDPLHGELFQAASDRGAFLNGLPIHVSATDRMERCLVATGFPYDRATDPDNNLAEFCRVMTRVQGVRRGGSAATDLAYVACGSLVGVWELKLKPWDMAAGMLLVSEAGGRISDGSGNPTDAYAYCVVATNGLIHDRLVEAIGRRG